MATNLTWATAPGTIANFPIGNLSTVDLIAVDTANTGATITYNKISGELPPGLTLDTNGTISGIPDYSTTSNNYFISLKYNFIVRARTSDGRIIDGQFIIIITNTVNQDFTWVTPAGTLGTIPNGQFYSLKIQAETSNNLGITYSFVSGELPPGMQLISHQVDKTIAQPYYTVTNTLRLSNLQTISIGDFVFGNNLPAGTRVISIDSSTNSVTLSATTTSTIDKNEVIKFYSPGYLQGVPTILNPVAVDESRVYRFTIRATNSLGRINDRAFTLNITNIYGPVIEPESTVLGSYYDGTFFNKQLQVVELNPNVQIEWAVTSGKLPPGLTLTSDGTLTGYLEPVILTGDYGPAGYDGASYVVAGVPESGILNEEQYDTAPYEFNQLSQSLYYTFTVQAFDGANYDLQTYILRVVSRVGMTADSSLKIDDPYLTVDSGNVRLPVIRNITSVLPSARQDSYYAFKIDGYDFSNKELTYKIVDTVGTFDGSPFDPLWDDSYTGTTTLYRPAPTGVAGGFDEVFASTSNLPGVLLDESTGWIHGKLNVQTTAYEEYKFGIVVCKIEDDGLEYCSIPKYFTLPVIGDPNSIIEWTSPSDLGTINNGTVSELSVNATLLSDPTELLVYTLVDQIGISCRLPQGLVLLPSGEISGRATFEAFTVDDYTTTFDNNLLTVDRTATFTVKAETTTKTSSVTKTFTLKLNVIDKEPYENLYIKAMPTLAQRQIYNSLLSDSNIFDPLFIYRPLDPYYGVQNELKMLFLPGLTASELSMYQESMTRNHFNKTYIFGDVKTAYVLDETYNVKYEVVYVEVTDPGENINGTGPALSTDLSNTISNPYISADGSTYNIIYPNSSENMKARLEAGIGYQDQSSLPPWMTSNQPDSATTTGFNIPLGYTKAVVIAYATPGNGKKIAYRIKQNGIDFNTIEFVADRYQLDNYYSSNYDSAKLTYVADRETTFDFDTNNDIGSLVASVTYGVSVPFNDINGRPIDYILANGGIDGITDFRAGETIVFTRQEQFANPGPYDGWVNYSSSFIGDNINTPVVEGFDYGGYDPYTVVPGYLEKSQQSVVASTVHVSATSVTNTPTGNVYTITVDRTSSIVPGSDIVFSGYTFGNLTTGITYQVGSIVDDTHITINKPATTQTFTEQILTGTGASVVEGLNSSPNTINTSVSVNGVSLIPVNDYIITGSAIEFNSAPNSGDLIIIRIYSTVGGKDLYNASGSMTGKVYTNFRGGVWQINIINNIVNLSCIQEITVNDRIRVLFGKTLSGAVLSYSLELTAGLTVPYYKTFVANPTIRVRTTFNNDTTRFFTYRDQYYTDGEQDKYVKFPQYGVFN